MHLGFRFQEALHGGFFLLGDPLGEKSADITLDIHVVDAVSFPRTRVAKLGASVHLEGLADDKAATGTLVLEDDPKGAVYQLSFVGRDGARYEYRGHKELSLLNFVDSFTLLRGSLYDEGGREIGRSTLRFDVRGAWPSLFKTFRLAF
jgi:hypothetical protein